MSTILSYKTCACVQLYEAQFPIKAFQDNNFETSILILGVDI